MERIVREEQAWDKQTMWNPQSRVDCRSANRSVSTAIEWWWLWVSFFSAIYFSCADPLPNTRLLEMEGDIASELVKGVDRFLLKKLDESVAKRGAFWDRAFDSTPAYAQSIQPNREQLRKQLGLLDERVAFEHPQVRLALDETAALYMKTPAFEAYRIQWPVVGDVMAEGLLLVPNLLTMRASGLEVDATFANQHKERSLFDSFHAAAHVIALPDVEQTPEALAGLAPGVPEISQFARRLAESGCRVMIPTLIGRGVSRRQSVYGGWGADLTHREYLQRPAFEMGRGILAYEVQTLLALVDWIEKHQGKERRPIGVMGYGDGGMLALYAGAVDTRIDAVGVSGYFGPREGIWEEPIDRNVFGLLEQFGDAELATLIAPRSLVIEATVGPEDTFESRGAAPSRRIGPDPGRTYQETQRARALLKGYPGEIPIRLILGEDLEYGSEPALESLLSGLDRSLQLGKSMPISPPMAEEAFYQEREARLIKAWDRYTQTLLLESPYKRQAFMKDLNTDSASEFEASANTYREYFKQEVIGAYDEPLLPFNARSRSTFKGDGWVGYEVVLDVYPDVIAYGILCVPEKMQPGEKRPVVVCQHGLEGRPQDILQGDHAAYHDFAARLASRGFITFSPQNLYLFQDRFRSLQRKSYPLKKTLFSIIVAQHQQWVDWLQGLPFVDPERVAFYGLSYGGKTAMRVPALVTDYCLSICSADFNDWVWKNASTLSPYSYVWSGEYEIFEFNLGHTFNYAEMAALIAPRPFMVERGHFDGVAPDERVALEFAKVRHLYQARLKLEDRCEIEWFDGPHTIHGEGTFEFLHKHLEWPSP